MRIAIRFMIAASLAYLALVLFWDARAAQSREEGGDPGLLVLYFGGIIVVAAIAALVFAFTVVPFLGELWANAFFSPPGEIEKDPHSAARARLAQGDYAGAVAEFQAVLEKDPSDRHALNEIVRLYCEKLDDPASAERVLGEALGHDLPHEEAAFIADRLVDVYWNYQGDFERARALLAQVAESLQGTQYEAAAKQRLLEIEQSVARGKLAAPGKGRR